MGQKELAARSTLSRQTISNIERERRGFSSEVLLSIANALGCHPHQLIGKSIFNDPRPTAHHLRQRSEILASLALLLERYPQRLPLAIQVVARLADHNYMSRNGDM